MPGQAKRFPRASPVIIKPACVMRDTTNCEGQAAIELEQVADRNCQDYRFEVSDDGSIILAQKVIRQSVGDLLNGVPPGNVPVEFHPEVANLIGSNRWQK